MGMWPKTLLRVLSAYRVLSAFAVLRKAKADRTLRSSRAVPHPSTDRALCRLISEVGREPAHSTQYGRQRRTIHMATYLPDPRTTIGFKP